jgi:hypothetical protein
MSNRPTILYGDHGAHVETVQRCLAIDVDGDFGRNTETAVRGYQAAERLEMDGIVGPQTWDSLEENFNLPAYPPPLLPPLPDGMHQMICDMARASALARYQWRDRGQAPIGYTEGMALSFATVVRNFLAGDSSATEMAKANTRDTDVDALAWYHGVFSDLEMDNSEDGLETLRHLYVLLIGLGMRESSGQHCCGRDQSADNVEPETAEAGAWQMSWNMKSASDEMQKLFDQFAPNPECPQCLLQTFRQDVECSAADWDSYGSGEGAEYQELAKFCPQFAAETTAIGLRKRRQHWGPINRLEAEVRPEADELLRAVQDVIQNIPIA